MGKFKVKETKTGSGFVFSLVAGNGEVIGVSQVYSAKPSCMKGVESVRKTAPKAGIEDQTAGESTPNPKFEIYTDKAGEFRFRLKASNGEIILASEGYKAKASCKNGIESVVKNAPESEVVEVG
ncbi:MAG: YegP family protein [Clostridiales bacterium]|nr:YegP family protein [Clostridiales bacterium]